MRRLLVPFLVVAPLAAAAAQDRPKGYLQRVALGAVAFALFGSCLGHLSFLANDTDYRPRLALVLIAVGFWDVARYITGKAIGGPKLAPHTHPDRTIAGAIGGAVVVIAFVMLAGRLVFADSELHYFSRLAVLGLFIALAAQLGDLMLAANQVLHNFLIFTSFALDGIAHAAEAILGAQVGSRDRKAFDETSNALAAAHAELHAAEEKWLELELLRAEVEGT